MSYYGQWYRRKENGELKKAKDNQKRSKEIINETAKKVINLVNAIQYQKQDYNFDLLCDYVGDIKIFKYKSNVLINFLKFFITIFTIDLYSFTLIYFNLVDNN